ncbi:MAG: 4-hydroxy-tetrahydrodipicolinate reductase [Dehalococcoidales bacterium]|nr:4-hydroxy-tetrahydrodipicolinate reductase [Dehalococcoidales bacterium]
MTIKVIVHGAMGKMGKEVVNAVCRDPETKLVGAVDINLPQDFLILPDGTNKVPLSSNLAAIIDSQKPDVMVDFSLPPGALPAIRTAAHKKVHIVTGTTGFKPADFTEMAKLAEDNHIGIIWASNFALGAVLMIHLAKMTAPYFDYAEITELHHHLKADAPSGTALTTAREMAKKRGKPFLVPNAKDIEMKSRGEQVEGVAIHSVRLPGLNAHQEVIFGAPGQTLIIRHDTINRECYMPGVMLSVKAVPQRHGLTSGLAPILGLKD